MPHLCEKMRRLTSKDSSARKKHHPDDEKAPDFYAISRANPLPETSSLPPIPTLRGLRNDVGLLTEMEAALLERERNRIDLLNRMNLLNATTNRAYQRDPRAALLQNPGMLSMGGMGNNGGFADRPMLGNMQNPLMGGNDFGAAPPQGGAANFAAIRDMLMGSRAAEDEAAQFMALENAARVRRARELGARIADDDVAQLIALERARFGGGYNGSNPFGNPNPFGNGNPFL